VPELKLDNTVATEALGAQLAAAIAAAGAVPLCVFLRGELGAGKTTLTRGLLRGLGHLGRVPSPTYTLVEPYELAGRRLWHLDLYRLGDPGALEYLGLGQMTGPGSVLLVEWPERGESFLPTSDLQIELKVIPDGRAVLMTASGAAGEALLENM